MNDWKNRHYFQEIQEYSVSLDETSINDLLIEWKKNGNLDVRNKFLFATIRLVIKIAKSIYYSFFSLIRDNGIDLMDLIGEGTLALLKFPEKFNPQKERFSTKFFNKWIRKNILKSLFNKYIGIVHVPERLRKRLLKQGFLSGTEGDDELSEEKIVRNQKWRAFPKIISFEQIIEGEEKIPLEEILLLKAEERYKQDELKSYIKNWISKLPIKERSALLIDLNLDDETHVEQAAEIHTQELKVLRKKALFDLRVSLEKAKLLQRLWKE